jgi:hypothetical protein
MTIRKSPAEISSSGEGLKIVYGFLAVLIAREVQSWKRGCVVTVAITIILSIALSRL